MIKKILILAANPGDTSRLRLDKEVSEIEKGLRRAKLREQFEIRPVWAVSFDDLRRALLDYEPQIVHFSGHGDKDGLMLEGEYELAETIFSEALSGLFELCSKHIECVILNACYSAPQAAALNKHINYVIGMPGKINDKAAIKFSVGFYDALGVGKSVEEAFRFGYNAVLQMIPDPSEDLIPVLNIRKGRFETDTQSQTSSFQKLIDKGSGEFKEKGQDVAGVQSSHLRPTYLIEKGLESLDLKEYKLAIENFQKALELDPENEEAQVLYCLSFLSGRPIRPIKQPDMNEIYKILKKVVYGEDQESANLARIVLGIIWIDYYLKKDHHYQASFFKENKDQLGDCPPSNKEKELIRHIVYSDTVKVIFRLF
jgi:tetratricopeptide (TPR) repeat protein